MDEGTFEKIDADTILPSIASRLIHIHTILKLRENLPAMKEDGIVDGIGGLTTMKEEDANEGIGGSGASNEGAGGSGASNEGPGGSGSSNDGTGLWNVITDLL